MRQINILATGIILCLAALSCSEKHPGIWKYTQMMKDYSFRLGSITVAENHSEEGDRTPAADVL